MTLSRNKSESVESIVRRMDDRFHFSSIEKESTVVTERELHTQRDILDALHDGLPGFLTETGGGRIRVLRVCSVDRVLDGMRCLQVGCDLGSEKITSLLLRETSEGFRVVKRICDYDPSGIDPHTPGAKLDAGKIRPDLVLGGFPRALTEVCKVGTFGAEKYTDDGWLYVENGIQRYADAAGRHKLKSDAGELYDQDAKERGWQIRHDAQVIWNLLAALELTLREEER